MNRVIFFDASVEKYTKKNPLPKHGMGYTAESRGILKLLEMARNSVISTITQLLPELEVMSADAFERAIRDEESLKIRQGRTIGEFNF